MKIFFLIMATALMLNSSCNNKPGVSNEQALQVLNTVLTDGRPWEKVHAAEFLIDLGLDSGVPAVFMSELNTNGHTPEYRIGIWRVMYKCAGEEEKQVWRENIRRAFTDPGSPDRIHAVETLAKLKIPAAEGDLEIIEQAMASDDYRLVFYTQWWAMPQSENGVEELKEHLLRIIRDMDNPARKLAAFVLSEDRDIRLDTEERRLLENFTASEPPNIYRLCLSIARNGEAKDMDILEPLLDHEENDVKIAAAYAILKLNGH